jgi:Mce-associated membrane protein
MARTRPIAGQRARTRGTDGRRTPPTPPQPPVAPPPSRTTVLDPPGTPEPARRDSDASRPAARRGPGRLTGWLSGWSGALKAVLAGLLALTLVAVAVLVLVGYRVRAEDRVETARVQALAAAQDNAVTILSYDYRHLDADFAAARKTLTGQFATDYASTTRSVVRPGAEQYHAVVKAEVAAGSVVSATADKVVVLLFVNQTTTSTRLDGPRVDLNRVQLTMVPVDGRWLVSKVTAL